MFTRKKSHQSNLAAITFMQKGFGAIVFILTIGLLSVGIVSGSFWYKNYRSPEKSSALNQKPSFKFVDGKDGVSDSKQETINGQQKYTNTNFGYSIEYPKDWVFDDQNTGGEGVSFFPKGKTIQQLMDKKGYYFEIWVIDEKGFSPKKYWEERIKEGRVRNPELKEVEYPAFKGIQVSDTRLDAHNYSVTGANSKYLFEFQLNFLTNSVEEGLKKYPESLKTFNEMLATFKFRN